MKKKIPSIAEQAREGKESVRKWARGEAALRVTTRSAEGHSETSHITGPQLEERHRRMDELKAIRTSLGLSQGSFAKALRVGAGTVRGWEIGRRTVPEIALALAEAVRDFPEVRRRLVATGAPSSRPASAARQSTRAKASAR